MGIGDSVVLLWDRNRRLYRLQALQSGCKKATCLIRPWDNLKKSLASVLERNGYTTEQVWRLSGVKQYPTECVSCRA